MRLLLLGPSTALGWYLVARMIVGCHLVANHVIRGLALSAPSLDLYGGHNGWKLSSVISGQ